MWTVIFASEYLRRVRTKTFVIVTLLVPVGIAAIAAVVGGVFWSARSAAEEAREQGVAVLDETGRTLEALREAAAADAAGGYRLVAARGPLAAAKQDLGAGRHPALLVLPRGLIDETPAAPIALYVTEPQSVLAEAALRRFVLGAVRELRLSNHELPPAALAAMREQLAFEVVEIAEGGEEQRSSARTSGAIATVLAMLVFFVSMLYGGAVMQAVMEERSSRMAEVIVAAAPPFELLLGKILAISGLAATQLGCWLLLVLAGGAAVAGVAAAGGIGGDDAAGLGASGRLDALLPAELPAMRWDVAAMVALMLPLGYLINASMFAALGAMHDSPAEAQMSVTLATLPMVLTVVVAQTMMLAPDGPLVVFASFFPLTAPAILPGRMLLVDLPWWQVAASVLLCVGAAAGMVWLCGRVFRGALLLYGKKITLRDLRHIVAAD